MGLLITFLLKTRRGLRDSNPHPLSLSVNTQLFRLGQFGIRLGTKWLWVEILLLSLISINQLNVIYFTIHKCMPKNLQDYLGNKVIFFM